LRYITGLYRSPHSGELNAGCLIRELIDRGEKVYCVPMQSWYDIGTPDDLARARTHYESRNG
jgi:NDP-sugar pyrophosphorylase family protein